MPINFDKLKKGFKEGLGTAAEKSSKTVEIQKTKAQILNLNNKVKNLYTDLGKEVYDLKDDKLSEISELKELFDKIESLKLEINNKESYIKEIKSED